MGNLKGIRPRLFRRTPDETYASLAALSLHCRKDQEMSTEHWRCPDGLWARADVEGQLMLAHGEGEVYRMNDWSFGQLCRLAGVSRHTVNRLSPETASRVFAETLPRGGSPLQVYTVGQETRSIHKGGYRRLYNAELLELIEQYGGRFESPPAGCHGATALYRGEQDMFLFLIDPHGWVEIGGESFAPGFFVWNSEVGRRPLGADTFWYQAGGQNRIVWDAIQVDRFMPAHTANVQESLGEIRRIILALVAMCDERRDKFAKAIRLAMQTKLGNSVHEAQAALANRGIDRSLARRAIELARQRGRLTVFAVVDALTRLARRIEYAGDRTEQDWQAGRLLTLAV